MLSGTGANGWAVALAAHDLPPWYVVYQQMQRRLRAGCFELLVEDVRSPLLRGRRRPTVVVGIGLVLNMSVV
jgi:hypothetical protein